MPVAPARWLNLPMGKSLRVHAEISGARPPTVNWRWSLTFEGEGPKMLAAATADADILLDRKGQYTIRAEAAPGCSGTATALVVDRTETPADYWVRALPPAGGVAPVEGIVVSVPPRQSVYQALDFGESSQVTLDPVAEDNHTAVRSYVRVTSPKSGVRLEGRTDGRPFDVFLAKQLIYEVLVIPDGALDGAPGTPAPKIFSDIKAPPVGLLRPPLNVEPGVAVSGRVSGPGGAVMGARVLLRAGTLPSTVGISDAAGQYLLNARAGAVGALIVPPPGSPLPQAQVDEGSVRIDPVPLALDFQWRTVPTVTLTLSVRSADGSAPVAGATVRLEAKAIPGVGTLTVGKSTPMTATGFVRVEAPTDAGGMASFPALPAATYSATLIPADSGAALTVTPLDLASATGAVARMVRLGRKLDVRGRLLPVELGGGATVVAVDPTADPARPLPAALADEAGMYRLSLDPGRPYRLFVEPIPARGLARIPLGLVAGDADIPASDHRLPTGVSITGVVTRAAARLGGALVQAYCVDGSADCKDPTTKDTEGIRPTAETVSDADGTFRLVVPDPAVVY
jgi:hypothetical protein